MNPDPSHPNAPSVPAAPSAGVSVQTSSSAIPGLQLEPGEFPIAVERTGAAFWLMVGLFALFIVTLPLALWLYYKSGQLYVVTNRRSVRIARNGTTTDLPHSALARVVPKKDFGYPSTLRLIPAEGSGHAELRFSSCGGFGETSGFTRLWGVLDFWVLSRNVAIDEAPAVDGNGAFVSASVGHDLLLVDGDEGLTIFTASQLIRLKQKTSRHSGSSITFHPTQPTHAYVLSLAQRATSIFDFEQRLNAAIDAGIVQLNDRHALSHMHKVKLSLGTLMFHDTSHPGINLVSVPRAQADAVRARLQRSGVQL